MVAIRGIIHVSFASKPNLLTIFLSLLDIDFLVADSMINVILKFCVTVEWTNNIMTSFFNKGTFVS